MSTESREWMYRPRRDKYAKDGICDEFRNGFDEFFHVAKSHPYKMDRDKIRCPCKKCKNLKFVDVRDLRVHLYQRGFIPNYYQWTAQGEDLARRESTSQVVTDNDIPQTVVHKLVNDVLRSSSCEREDPNPFAKKSYKDLEDADTPLYEGCETHTTLSFAVRLSSIMSDFNLSQECCNRTMELIQEILPRATKLPSNFYDLGSEASSIAPDVSSKHQSSSRSDQDDEI